MHKVKWGIISTAKIGTKKVIPAMQQGACCEIVAIASRDLQRAQEAAEQLDIPRAYGSYEELMADPDIEAIYNPLPNHLHVPISIKAIEAGKHVERVETDRRDGETLGVTGTPTFFVNQKPLPRPSLAALRELIEAERGQR